MAGQLRQLEKLRQATFAPERVEIFRATPPTSQTAAIIDRDLHHGKGTAALAAASDLGRMLELFSGRPEIFDLADGQSTIPVAVNGEEMPRRGRLDFAGARHHVMCRGGRREAIFRDDRDRQVLLETLGEAAADAVF